MNTNTHAHAHTHIIKLYALNLKGVYFLSSYRFLKCCINIYLYFWFKTLYQIIFDYHSQFPTKPYFIIFIFFLKYIRKKLCQLEAIMNEIMCLRSNVISRVVFFSGFGKNIIVRYFHLNNSMILFTMTKQKSQLFDFKK